MGWLVYISTSNHGEGANKCLKSGCYEDKHTRPIGDEFARQLIFNGFEAVVAKAGTTMKQRCAEADKLGADLYVPIHTNAAGSASARYLMLMFNSDSSTNRTLFNCVSKRLEAVYPGNKEAVYDIRSDLYECKTPKARTLYTELGFHTNPTDVNDFIHNPKMVGKALAWGVCDFFGVPFKDADAVEEKEEVKPKVDGLYLVRVSSEIDIYKAPLEVTEKCPKGAYTIVEEKNGFGKLKSSTPEKPRWIKLSEVKKL